jgi:hypothetical protein
VSEHDAPNTEADDRALIRSLPKEVGVLLTVMGLGGLIFPGPWGTPFLLMGGLVLWPRGFEGAEAAFQRRWPQVHQQSIRQLRRFVADLERRYPSAPEDQPS